MKELGGYFELELPKGSSYYNELIKLNSGRNALKYILTAKMPTKVYIPSYICDTLVEPLETLLIKYEFYNIDKNFEIVQNIQLQDNEMIFYVNYFALKSKYIGYLSEKYVEGLIVDNSQAFFEKYLSNVDTIYSPRKFFGVSDGGYLSTNVFLNKVLEQDESYSTSIHLLGRVDKNASSFYDDYQKSEQRLVNQPIKYMSKLTQAILSSVDCKKVINKRKNNFKYLQKQLSDRNLLSIENNLDFVPFVYPLMIDDDSLKEKLNENKIYVAKYWDEALKRNELSNIEKEFINQILPLPIDQRYTLDDMARIVEVIKDNL